MKLNRKMELDPEKENKNCAQNVAGGDVPGIKIGQYTFDTIEQCSAACQADIDCEYTTYWTGEHYKGKCILTKFCSMESAAQNPNDGYATTVMKKGCTCLHRYEDQPCECQHPEIKIDFPDQNAGMAAVFDPMNPSANSNSAARR